MCCFLFKFKIYEFTQKSKLSVFHSVCVIVFSLCFPLVGLTQQMRVAHLLNRTKCVHIYLIYELERLRGRKMLKLNIILSP